jgi:hypothetical protein
LEAVSLPAEAPRLEPAIEAPQGILWPMGPQADELAQPPAPDEYDQRCGPIDFVE